MKDEQAKGEQARNGLTENALRKGALTDEVSIEDVLTDDAQVGDDAILAELTAGLRDLDMETEPSAEFHRTLMTRLCLEQKQDERKQVYAAVEEKVNIPKADASGTNVSGKEASGTGVDIPGTEVPKTEVAERVKIPGGSQFGSAFSGKSGRKASTGWRERLRERWRLQPVFMTLVSCCGAVLVFFVFSGVVSNFRDSMYSVNAMFSGESSPSASPATAAAGSSAQSGGGWASDEMAAGEWDMAEMEDMAPMEPSGMPPDGGFLSNSPTGMADMDKGADDGGFAEAGVAQTEDATGTAGAGERGGGGAGGQGQIEQKIIRTGEISLEVEHFDEAAAAIRTTVIALGGYVTNEGNRVRGDGDSERKVGEITVRIPFDSYDRLTEQTAALGKVLESNVDAQDVTDQYIDLRARIQVYETKYQRLMALLEQSGDMDTILRVENELASTNAELESLKGQIRYLQDRTDYSTLSIYLTEKEPEAVEIRTTGFAGFVQRVKEAFNRGINGMVRACGDFIIWLVYNLTSLIFLALAFCVCWFLWLRKWWKRHKARKAE